MRLFLHLLTLSGVIVTGDTICQLCTQHLGCCRALWNEECSTGEATKLRVYSNERDENWVEVKHSNAIETQTMLLNQACPGAHFESSSWIKIAGVLHQGNVNVTWQTETCRNSVNELLICDVEHGCCAVPADVGGKCTLLGGVYVRATPSSSECNDWIKIEMANVFGTSGACAVHGSGYSKDTQKAAWDSKMHWWSKFEERVSVNCSDITF